MARRRTGELTLADIERERAQIEAKLRELNEAEKRARDIAADAGRATLLSALEKVRIGAMTRSDAKAIANAIASLGAAELVAKLSA